MADAPASTTTAPAPAAAAPAAAPAPATTALAAAPAASASLVGDAPLAFDAEGARAYLTEKGGKAEELAALDEAALKAKFDEAKAAEGKPAPVTADAIEIKVPEGFTVDEKVMGDFKAALADAKLTPSERAQKLVDMHAAALKDVNERSQKFWKETNDKWVAEINADPEIGTANQALRDKVFSTALSAYGKQYGAEAEKGLREALGMTGAGNNLHIARMIFAAWKDRVESGPTSGKPANAEDAHKKALAAMYPTANVP